MTKRKSSDKEFFLDSFKAGIDVIVTFARSLRKIALILGFFAPTLFIPMPMQVIYFIVISIVAFIMFLGRFYLWILSEDE